LLNLVKNHFKDYIQFLKEPNPNPNHRKISGPEKWKTLFIFLVIDFLLIIPAVFFIYIIQEFVNVDLDNHAVSDLANKYGLLFIIVAGGIISPLIEEIIFRLPLNYKRNYLFRLIGSIVGKKTISKFWLKYFPLFFYLFVIAFAAVHIFNYRDESSLILLLSPILILPQIIGGTIIAYLRLKLGFLWGFLQHSIFNILLVIISFTTNVEQKFDIDNEDFLLKIEVAENRYGKESKIAINRDFDFTTELHAKNVKFNQLARELHWQKVMENDNKQFFHVQFRIKNLKIDSDSVLQHHLKKIIADQ